MQRAGKVTLKKPVCQAAITVYSSNARKCVITVLLICRTAHSSELPSLWASANSAQYAWNPSPSGSATNLTRTFMIRTPLVRRICGTRQNIRQPNAVKGLKLSILCRFDAQAASVSALEFPPVVRVPQQAAAGHLVQLYSAVPAHNPSTVHTSARGFPGTPWRD